MGISKSTASTTFKKYQSTPGELSSKKRTGRPSILTKREESIIVRTSVRNPFKSAKEIQNIFNFDNSKSISRQLVSKILFQRGLKSYVSKKKPLLTKYHSKRRKSFAKSLRNVGMEFWNRVVFSDECSIQINPGLAMQKVRRFSTSNPYAPDLIRPTTKFPISVMVWGCISMYGYGRLHICEGNMNSDKYIEVVEKKFIPSASDHDINNPIFQQDSAPCHTSRKVKRFFEEMKKDTLPWPGYSPDLNPIENIWSELKRRVAKKTSRNKRQLIENIIKVWNDELPKELPRKLIETMPSRILKVLKNRGYTTKY